MIPDKITEGVFEYLKQCAAEGRTAPYGEIAKEVGLPKALCVMPHLDYIRDEICIPRKLPWLTVLAVNRRTRVPGFGWFPDDTATRDDRLLAFLGGTVLLVFATDWSEVKFESSP